MRYSVEFPRVSGDDEDLGIECDKHRGDDDIQNGCDFELQCDIRSYATGSWICEARVERRRARDGQQPGAGQERTNYRRRHDRPVAQRLHDSDEAIASGEDHVKVGCVYWKAFECVDDALEQRALARVRTDERIDDVVDDECRKEHIRHARLRRMAPVDVCRRSVVMIAMKVMRFVAKQNNEMRSRPR